ncbi:MAG: helix-turn-helix domain-containing protein, partial [Antricoccus sp.]
DVSISAGYDLERLTSADLVIIPGWDIDAVPPAEITEALIAVHRLGAYVASFCDGAFLLAQSGLLDGLLATTHHQHGARFRQQFPQIDLDPDVLYVINDNKVVSSAGTSAAIDLCLELVRQSDGSEVANIIARQMVVPPQRQGGQAQFVDKPIAVCHDHAMTRLLDEVMLSLAEPHSVESMAASLAMSPRTFARKFSELTATTPYKWLLAQRVRHAQLLLEITDDSIEAVATRAGFSDATTMRIHFGRIIKTTPTAYRKAFSRS